MGGLAVITRPRLRSRLAVAVPASIPNFDGSSGTGKMWQRALPALSELGIRVDVADAGRRHRLARRPDVWLTDGHMGALEVNEPVVAHLMEAPWMESPDDHFLDPQFVESYRGPSHAAAQQAAMVIAPSEFSRRQIIKAHQVEPDKVCAVPFGVDREVFNPSKREAGLRLLPEGGRERPYVAFVSTVHPRKNLGALREAMTILADRGHQHGLVLVISPAPDRQDSTDLERDATADLPGHPNRVIALRRLQETEVASVMAAASALCSPSWSEGFGFAPLEAMACGTPVVVSNRGSLPEVVGDAGLVVAPDPLAIADALERILLDETLAASFAEAGQTRSRRLNWGATAAGWLDVLERAAS